MNRIPDSAPRRPSWKQRSRNGLLLILIFLLAGEVTSRFFWRFRFDLPVLGATPFLDAYYPELGRIATRRPTREDPHTDILLLGGSVLERNWGNVEPELLEQLALAGHRGVRISNLARPAHTSRDSLLKYAALGDARFELVIVYHGVNEARANNVPPRYFRDDYEHIAWYETVNALAPAHRARRWALPTTLGYVGLMIRQRLARAEYVPIHQPRRGWVRHGDQIRSAEAFRGNLAAIRDLATQRGDRLALMTFALYVPEDYSREAFDARKLDYALHRSPLEIWGSPANVRAAVDAHNQVIRDLATPADEILFVDQSTLMQGPGAHWFNDPCHLTGVGSARFVANMIPALAAELDRQKQRP